MTTTQNLTWKAYRDGDRYIIGPREWQGSAVSLTHGICEAYSKSEANSYILWAKEASLAEIESRRRTFDTYDRFEAACDAGKFGPEW